MDRKEISVKLADNEYYIFSERNREDVNFSAIQDRIRQQRIKFIQENIADKDNQLALMMNEMNKVYSSLEVGIFITSDLDEMYATAFNSFKIKNPDCTLEKFRKLLPETDLRRVASLVVELESSEKKSLVPADSTSGKKQRKR